MPSCGGATANCPLASSRKASSRADFCEPDQRRSAATGGVIRWNRIGQAQLVEARAIADEQVIHCRIERCDREVEQSVAIDIDRVGCRVPELAAKLLRKFGHAPRAVDLVHPPEIGALPLGERQVLRFAAMIDE